MTLSIIIYYLVHANISVVNLPDQLEFLLLLPYKKIVFILYIDQQNDPAVPDFFSLEQSKGTFRLKQPLTDYPFSASNDNEIQVTKLCIP